MRGKVFAVSSLALMLPLFMAVADPALPVNQIVAFGDSLTDTGNASIYASTHGLGAIPGPGYAPTEYTNPPGPGIPSGLWIDQFAAKAGLPDPQPVFAGGGGTNYAVAGAQTGSDSSRGDVGFQLGEFAPPGTTTVSSTNLYTFWAGANDIIGGNSPITAADNLADYIATLKGEGAKYFLWFNLPLLGDTPRGQMSGESAVLNAATIAFDTEWGIDRHKLENEFPGIVLVGVDINALFQQILNAPGHDGFNVTDIPQDIPGANPNNYLFWDGLHPTTAADTLIADLALTDFEAALTPSGPGTGSTVPEPASVALALFGVCGVFAASKLKAKYRR